MDSTEVGWAVVAEYGKTPSRSHLLDYFKKIPQAETGTLKKKNTKKSKSGAFKPSSTIRNPRIG